MAAGAAALLLAAAVAVCRSYLTQSVYKVVLQKSIPTEIRQLDLYISNDNEHIDGFVRELTFAK